MGYFFTLLYITTAYITPPILFGPLAPYHVEVVIAVLAVLFSIPNISSSELLRLPQTYAMLALCFAVAMSFAGNGYLGGVGPGMYSFSTSAMAYFLTAVNVRKVRHIQLLVAAIVASSIFFIICGWLDVHNHVIPSPYVFGAETLPRIRGLGLVNDPNDFSQVLVTLIPLVFLWKSGSMFKNALLMGLPITAMIVGMFLTHSRGAAIALMVVVFFAGRKKIGTVPAAILGGVLLVGALAFGWSGGRDVSMEAGADRLDAWSVGIGFIKAHPLVGVGDHRFADFNEITAHNSVIVCAAEIGLPGFVAWVLFVFSTYRLGLALGKDEVEGEAEAAPPVDRLPSPAEMWKRKAAPLAESKLETAGMTPVLAGPAGWGIPREVAEEGDRIVIPRAEIRRIARLLIICITGFLAAGWFLSRALSTWLFMYAGLLCAVVHMAAENGIVVRRDSAAFLLRWSIIIAVGLLIFVYVLLRVRTVLGS